MTRTFGPTLTFLAAAALVAGAARAHDGIETRLKGYQETPAVSTSASGKFKAKIKDQGTSIDYELNFAGLEGDVTQAHIHFGQKGVAGGISIWLCGTAALPGPAGTPACGGPRDSTVTGTLTAAGVVGPNAQGIAPGEFSELVAAIKAGVAYANVHSAKFPAGELRGQLSDD